MTFTPSSPSGERHFVRFTEKNEHEGETWHLWLQTTGNEAEFAKFRALLDAAQVGSRHILADHVEPEWAVDILVEYADGETTWAPTHQKITGKFTCPDDLGEHAELLYKCGARKFFTGDASSDAENDEPVPSPQYPDERTWVDIITVLRYVSAGIGYTRTAATLYPDARARRALGALRDLRWDVPEELSPSDKKE